MIYLTRISKDAIDLAVCEDANRVPPYEARGYTRVTHEQYSATWMARDLITLGKMIKDAPVLVERTVGQQVKPGYEMITS